MFRLPSSLTIDATIDLLTIPPADLMEGALETNTMIRMFEEQTSVVNLMGVNATAAGQSLSASADSTLSTEVTGWFIHMEPLGGMDKTVSGVLEFDRAILGIIWKKPFLDLSDTIVGLGGTTCSPQSFRGAEASNGSDNLVFVSDNRVDFTMRAQDAKVDSFRILGGAQQVPAPPALFVLIIAMGLFKILKIRRL